MTNYNASSAWAEEVSTVDEHGYRVHEIIRPEDYGKGPPPPGWNYGVHEMRPKRKGPGLGPDDKRMAEIIEIFQTHADTEEKERAIRNELEAMYNWCMNGEICADLALPGRLRLRLLLSARAAARARRGGAPLRQQRGRHPGRSRGGEITCSDDMLR